MSYPLVMHSFKSLVAKKRTSNPIKINVRCKHYPCLCESIWLVLCIARLTGLMPISASPPKRHTSGCKFVVHRKWLWYTYALLIVFIPYVCVMYTIRLNCGPNANKVNSLEWYVMTFGYIITDIETIVSLMMGIIMANSFCTLLEKVSKISGILNEMVRLQMILNRVMKFLYPCVLFVFASYTYVAWLRSLATFDDYRCTLLDQPFAVIIRGITLIYPSAEIIIVIMLTSLIVSKFNDLYDATNLALHVCTTTGNTSALEQVSLTHQQINGAVKEINRCFGIQMLMGITSSLYTTIYYLYRVCTINYKKTHSNPQEQIHYFLSLLYRSCKLIIYTVLGHNISYSSKKPLEAFQNTSILQFPSKTLEQIQLLVILWQGQQALLSGFGVVNIGPWLLAPIVGNVITYLLVALQFQNSGADISQNVSAYLEYVL